MVKDPLGEWDKVYTFCALLVDLGPQVVALTRAEVPHILPWPTHLKIPVSAPEVDCTR